MAPPLLNLREIRLTFGGTPLLTGTELSVAPGERVALVGRNGSGKSTLLKIAAGFVAFDSGERFLQPGTTMAYLPQEPDLRGFDTIGAYAAADVPSTADPYRATYLLEQLGLEPARSTEGLSGGEIRRAAIARTLAAEPDILMLDEPTNHLDLTAIEWLEAELLAFRGALVLISHDRRFLQRLSRQTVWLDRGVTRRLDKGFAEFEDWRDAVVAEEEENLRRMDKRIEQEMHWLARGVTARRRRNMGRLRNLMDLRQTRKEHRSVQGSVRMDVSESAQSGRIVAEAKTVTKSFGDAVIVKDFSQRILRGDRVGFVGPNGAGKTTLLNLLTGVLAPDAGTIRLGTNLQMVTLDQKRESLDPDVSVVDTLSGGAEWIDVAGKRTHVSTYLRDFLFLPEQMRTPVKALSGGERGRLMLARALAKPSNLLVLDEPTNDLDLETLDLLQELLADYDGTVLLVSHDRDFIDRVVTSTLLFEGGGRITEYAGGYSDMLAQRGAPAPIREDARKASKAAAPVPTPAAAQKKTAKLSFKQKHALETLPATMERLQAEIAALAKTLSDPALYARDPKAFEKATAATAAKQAELEKAEEEWLDLEMLREELEG